MSTALDILNAVKAKLQAVAGIPTVVVRKRLMLLENDDLPIIIISLVEQSQDIRFRVFGKAAYDYNVGVALVEAGNREFTNGQANSYDLQQKIRYNLNAIRLTGAASVWDTNIDINESSFMPIDGNAMNYQISTWLVTYSTLEDVLVS